MRIRGFTLIELVIVLAIIGILAAVLIPMFVDGSKPLGARDFSLEPANAVSVPAEAPALRCEGGFLQKRDGEVVTKDGVAVRC